MTSPSTAHAAWVGRVLEEHERPLVAYALRLMGDLESARDVVQDVFVRLLSADRSQIEVHVAEWLFTVCRNRCVDLMRKERRMTALTDGQVQNAPALAVPAHEAGSEAAEGREAVRRCLESLPPRQQEVIRLKFQAGLSYREIARVTELTVTNVGFLIHAGLKAMREHVAAPSTAAAASEIGGTR